VKYILFLALFVAVSVGGVSPQPAFAQKMLEDFLKPMPEIDLMDKETFDKSSTLYKETPAGDEALSYELRLPKKWTKQENKALAGFAVSNKLLGEVERFYGPVRIGERSYFSIKTVELDYKLTAEQWLVLYMLENGYTIEGIRTLSNNRVEVIYVFAEHNVTYIASAVAQITGSIVVFSQYVVPSDAWEEEKSVSLRVIESFKLDTIDDGFVEPMTPYRFLDVAELMYPNSWELKAKPLRSADKMSISLLNVEAQNKYSSKRILKGKMEAHLLTEYIVDDIDEDIDNFIQEMSVDQLRIQDTIEEFDDFTVDENMEVVEIKAYEAIDKQHAVKAYEYWLAVMYSGEYYYFVTLLTPSRDEDYYSWARNTQTFRVLVENIQPLM